MHKNRRLKAFTAFLFVFVLFLLPLKALSLPGDASDPLVSKSWVDDYVNKAFNDLEKKANDLLEQAKLLTRKKIELTLSSNTAYINGIAYQMDVVPKVVTVSGGGVTLVPLRFVGEALNISVNWDSATNTVTCQNSEIKVILPLDSDTAQVNGVITTLLAPPVIENYRTLVPLRFIGEAFGCYVDWNGSNQKITVTNYR